MIYRRKQSNPHEFIIKCTVITSFMAFDNHADMTSRSILFHFYGVISVSKFEIPDASVRNFMQAVKNFMQAFKTLCKRSKLYASGQNFMQAVMQGVQTSRKRSKTGVPKLEAIGPNS